MLLDDLCEPIVRDVTAPDKQVLQAAESGKGIKGVVGDCGCAEIEQLELSEIAQRLDSHIVDAGP